EFSFEPGYSDRMSVPGDYDIAFSISPQGLRDDRTYAPEHPGTTRILLVGDSFVFGVGVELQDTLGRQLERDLNEDGAHGRPVEVVAVGVPGYGLDAYATLIERWVPRLHPDLIVVALFTGNDLMNYDVKRRDPRQVIEGTFVSRSKAWSWNLRKYSALASALLKRWNPYPAEAPETAASRDPESMLPTMLPWIERIAAPARSGGPPVSVLVIHGRETVLSWRDEHQPQAVRDQQARFLKRMNETLDEFTRRGASVFNPQEAWVSAPPPPTRYFLKIDAHLSAEGDGLMAGYLATQLRQHLGAALAGAPERTSQPPR
ncbi:MAG TPA: GDSL-type esterase/lipase family protein, partial [Planctomycetota bacterium]|nr:GDSL-type esterase/lipase family protein [Planctomycetota bacterium]